MLELGLADRARGGDDERGGAPLHLGDVDRENYAAIGESDRMTLKFVKKKIGNFEAFVVNGIVEKKKEKKA